MDQLLAMGIGNGPIQALYTFHRTRADNFQWSTSTDCRRGHAEGKRLCFWFGQVVASEVLWDFVLHPYNLIVVRHAH